MLGQESIHSSLVNTSPSELPLKFVGDRPQGQVDFFDARRKVLVNSAGHCLSGCHGPQLVLLPTL